MPDPDMSLEKASGTTEHQLGILIQKVMGTDQLPPLTEPQVNEMLSQKREIASYIHEDKKRESRDGKFIFVAVILFILFFSLLVLLMKPEVFSEVLSLIIGAFGGYGLGKKSN